VAIPQICNNSHRRYQEPIQAEGRVTEANIRRLEEKIEKVENLLLTRLAGHDTRIGRLESR
jgi:hypothetical protein